MEIHGRRTGTGHRGLKEGSEAGERERAVEAALVLLVVRESHCRGQEEGAGDLRKTFQRMLYFVRPIVRTDLPTFAGWGFPQ